VRWILRMAGLVVAALLMSLLQCVAFVTFKIVGFVGWITGHDFPTDEEHEEVWEDD